MSLSSIDPSTSLGSRLLGAATRVTVGNIVSRTLAFLIGIVVARTLTTVEFGGFGAVLGAVSFTATLSSLSLGVAATRYVAMYREQAPERSREMAQLVVAISTTSSAVMGLVLFLAAPWVSHRLLAQPFLETPLRIAALLMVGTVVAGVASGVLLGLERFTEGAIVSVIQNVVILVGFLLVGERLRLTGAVAVHALGFGTALILTLVLLRDLLFRAPKELVPALRRHVRELASFCLPHTLGAFVTMPAVWGATVLLARSQPDGYAELGYFTAGQRFFLLISFVAGFMATALFPILSGLDSYRDEARRAVDYGLIGTGLLVVPLSVGMAFAAPLLMRLFGPDYQSHWTVLLPIIAWAALNSMGAILWLSLIARGHQWFVFLQQAGYALALVFLAYLLRSLGAPGLASAHLIGVFSVAALSLVPITKLLHLSSRATIGYLYAMALPITAGALSLLMVGMWRWVGGFVGVALSTYLYARLLSSSERSGLVMRLGLDR